MISIDVKIGYRWVRKQYLEDQLWVAYNIVKKTQERNHQGKSRKDKDLEVFKTKVLYIERENTGFQDNSKLNNL